MSLRLEQKQLTRDNIIEKTTLLLEEKGFIKVSSKDISKSCGVSQGTIFLHFKTKNNLLNTILASNVSMLEKEITERCNANLDPLLFVRYFIDAITEYEAILSRAYKDYYYLEDSLQKQIDDLGTLIKNRFFDNLKSNRSTTISIIDAFTLIDAFISQIKQYLLEKNVYSRTNSVMKQRRGRIMKLYRMLFEVSS